MSNLDFDVLVIGSGFGGSVAALRLSEKGYRVGVLEAGRRFEDHELPRNSWHLRDFLWAPQLGCTGIQRIHLLKDVLVLAGAGVGGGSLNYANTLYTPGPTFFQDPQWSSITDWQSELAPYYDQARRMLGVADNPTMTPSDEVMRAVADRMGVGETFRLTPVGVFFGDGPGVTSPDPFFGGAGPERTGCTECGECMSGCRHGAKNTLVKNYLHLAESAGAVIHPMTTVTALLPRTRGGYLIETYRTGTRQRRTFTAEHVILAAGTYGTQRLLHRMKAKGMLPNLSPALGRKTRTNSEAILGAVTDARDHDFTRGVAITSSFHPDEVTHVEPCRYGKGSNSMGLMESLLTTPRAGRKRWQVLLSEIARRPVEWASLLDVRQWSERSVIALVMQTVDNSLTVKGVRSRLGRWHLTTEQDGTAPSPTYLPVAHEVVRLMAEQIDGVAAGSIFENFDAAVTAHFVGGCAIGADPEHGVIDAYHRVYGYEGLHIVDGSAITANLGVNPSLTITAQAERAMALWPNRGEADRRPPMGDPYRHVSPTPPNGPVVPSGFPGELRVASTSECAAGPSPAPSV